jgi:hypothetical protein
MRALDDLDVEDSDGRPLVYGTPVRIIRKDYEAHWPHGTKGVVVGQTGAEALIRFPDGTEWLFYGRELKGVADVRQSPSR